MPKDIQEISAQHLYPHVDQLAGKIGEHDVYHLDALHAAETYITEEWQRQGYVVSKQIYTVRGAECANLEINVTPPFTVMAVLNKFIRLLRCIAINKVVELWRL